MNKIDQEVWMQGPIEGVPALLQPVAHALLQVSREVEVYMQEFPRAKLWEKPAGRASVAFHLQHMAGVIDRMFTYALDKPLSTQQFQYLSAEGQKVPDMDPKALVEVLQGQIQQAMQQLKQTPEAELTHMRYIGRKRIPTTLMGLLFHAAEHSQRHLGQLLVSISVLEKAQI